MTSFSAQTLDMVHDVSETSMTKLIGTGYYDKSTIQKSLQGTSLAISEDALTMAIGGPDHDRGIGCVWVYTRLNFKSEWIPQGNKLRGTSYIGKGRQGSSVSLSHNGDVLIFGGPQDNNGAGAIWIFKRIEHSWYQVGAKISPAFASVPLPWYHIGAKISPEIVAAGTPPNFGTSVAVSGDGNTIAFGGPNYNYYQSNPESSNVPIGIVWVYGLQGNLYVLEGGALGGVRNGYKSKQGVALSLSDDGQTLAVGGYDPSNDFGEVFVFLKIDTKEVRWMTELAHEVFLTPDQPKVQIGQSVSLSGDGNSLIVGGYYPEFLSGCSWLFLRDINNKWTYSQHFVEGKIAPYSVDIPRHTSSLSRDGKVLCIGCTDNITKDTVIKLKEKALDGKWYEKGKGIKPLPIIPFIKNGIPTLISGNGRCVIFGITQDNKGVGSSRCYTLSDDGRDWIGSPDIVAPDVTGRPHQGHAIAMTKDGLNLAVGGPEDNNGLGSVWFFTKEMDKDGINKWIPKGEKLIPVNNIKKSHFGYSLAMSSTDDILVIGGPGDDNGKGAAWIYRLENNVWTYQEKLVDNNSAYNPTPKYGTSVSISKTNTDLSIIALGGPDSNYLVGSVITFENRKPVHTIQCTDNTDSTDSTRSLSDVSVSENKWIQFGNMIMSKDPDATSQGTSVSLSGDGKTIAVGCPRGDISCSLIFTLSADNSWVQTGDKLIGNVASYDSNQGTCLSIDSGGGLLAIGAPNDNNNTGAVFTFRLENQKWVEKILKLIEKDATEGSMFGQSIFLYDRPDGTQYLAVGSPKDSGGNGSVWIYELFSDKWLPAIKDEKTKTFNKIGNLPNRSPNCGTSVVITNNLKSIGFGGSMDDGNVGATWVVDL